MKKLTRDSQTQSEIDVIAKKSELVQMFESAIDKDYESKPVTVTFTRGELVFLMMMNNLAMAYQQNDQNQIDMLMPMIAYLGMIHADGALETLITEGKESYQKLWQTQKIIDKLGINGSKDSFFK